MEKYQSEGYVGFVFGFLLLYITYTKGFPCDFAIHAYNVL
jgi:hypothetical protein